MEENKPSPQDNPENPSISVNVPQPEQGMIESHHTDNSDAPQEQKDPQDKPAQEPPSSPLPPAPPPSHSMPPVPSNPTGPSAVPSKPSGMPPVPQKPGAVGTSPGAGKVPGKASGAQAKLHAKEYKFLMMVGLFLLTGIGMWGSVKIYKRFFAGPANERDLQKSAGKSEVAVNVLEVKMDRFQDILVAVGTIAGGSEIPLRFEVEGKIVLFEFREGDKARKGDIIARLNQRDAYLKLKRAELELDQYEKLYAIGGIARNRLEEARVAADLARSELDKTVIRAPRDGIVGDKDAEVGEYVTPNKKIATLVNIESVVVRVGIIEKEIDKVFPGQKVVLTVDTYPGVEFTGTVKHISPLVQGTSKTLTVEARLANEGGLLLPGMFARTRIAIFEEDNTISVPNDAVEKTQTGHRVFVVSKENTAQSREVEVGYISSQFSQITYGLSPGELVVTQKPQDLKDGASVKVIEVQK